MGEYKEIAAKLKEADAILIGASNGFSISEGLHIFADNQAFEEVFGDFKRAYGIRNILSGLFADWPSEEVKWAFLIPTDSGNLNMDEELEGAVGTPMLGG